MNELRRLIEAWPRLTSWQRIYLYHLAMWAVAVHRSQSGVRDRRWVFAPFGDEALIIGAPEAT